MKRIPVAIAACLLVALACKQRPSETSHNPDLIYILTIDALRSDVIGLRHNGELVMRELTKFAEESVYFDHAYAQAPFTKISVASLFTGLWPSRLGVKHCILDTFPKGVELCRDLGFQFDTMAEYLSDSGYRTITHLFTYHARQGSGLLQGFDHQEKTLEKWQPGSGKAFYYQHILGLHAPYKAAKASLDRLSIGPPGGDADPGRSDWYWQPLTREQGMHLYEHYLALGDAADREFADLRRALMKQGIWDEALVVVTADHGEEFLEHGGTQHSVQLYEEVLRVPLFIKFPASSPHARQHGRTLPNRVRLVDVFPTLVHLLSGEEARGFDGKSLLPILGGQELDAQVRPVLALTSISRKFDGKRTSFESRAVISGSSKAIWGHRVENSQLSPDFDFKRGDEIRELFDLGNDPDEQRNLASEQPGEFESLQREFLELSTSDRFVSGSARAGQTKDTRPVAAPATPEKEQRHRVLIEEQLRALGYIE